MNLRFRVLNTPNNIDPDTFACSATFSPAALNMFSLLITVNGSAAVNIPIGGLNTGTNITTVVGSLTATLTVENSNYLKLNLNLADPSQSADIRIKVAMENYTVYDNTFKAYGIDIGKNPNIV